MRLLLAHRSDQQSGAVAAPQPRRLRRLMTVDPSRRAGLTRLQRVLGPPRALAGCPRCARSGSPWDASTSLVRVVRVAIPNSPEPPRPADCDAARL
jgi:hypothetical protein